MQGCLTGGRLHGSAADSSELENEGVRYISVWRLRDNQKDKVILLYATYALWKN